VVCGVRVRAIGDGGTRSTILRPPVKRGPSHTTSPSSMTWCYPFRRAHNNLSSRLFSNLFNRLFSNLFNRLFSNLFNRLFSNLFSRPLRKQLQNQSYRIYQSSQPQISSCR
jgi:hypothetical protein